MCFDRNDFCFWQASEPIVLHVNVCFCQWGRTQMANYGSGRYVLIPVKQCSGLRCRGCFGSLDLQRAAPHGWASLCARAGMFPELRTLPGVKCGREDGALTASASSSSPSVPCPHSPFAALVSTRSYWQMSPGGHPCNVSPGAAGTAGERLAPCCQHCGVKLCQLVCHKDLRSLINQTAVASRNRDFVFLKEQLTWQ